MLEIRRKIRKLIFESLNNIYEEEIIESLNNIYEEEIIDEERLVNSEVLVHVKNKENFIGTHIWGEKIGSSDDYVVVSYGVQFPIFIWDSENKKWYGNSEEYIYKGEVISATKDHKELTRPTINVFEKTDEFMKSKLKSLMKKNGVSELEHTSVEPGEKN